MFSSLHLFVCRLPSTTGIRLLTLLISFTLLTRPISAKTLPDSMDIDEAPREEVSDSSDNDISQNIADDRILNRSKPKECKMVDNEAMLGLMNKVCELCHDMYSHTQPNMRVKCSSNCFRNKTFKKCLNLFSPSSRSLRHTLHRKHSSIVLD